MRSVGRIHLAVFLMGLWFSAPVHAITETYQQPYLGISDTFGRWNGTINWSYNPTGAPTLFKDNSKVVSLMQEVMAEWEGVSGVKFSHQGVNTALKDVSTDNVVAVIWGNANGAAAMAGPSRSYSTGSDTTLGYDPYTDGSVVISDSFDWTEGSQLSTAQSEALFKKILLHEVGHLIGLGHSDNPVSIMYANPYNNIGHLMADDIAAALAHYGASANPVTAAVYTPPTSSKTIFNSSSLFLNSSGASKSVTTLTDSTADSDVLYISLSFNGSFSKTVEIIVTDPSGYSIQETTASLSCAASFICSSYQSIGYTDILKKVTGVYHVYVVADAQQVAHQTFTVSTNPVWNRPPSASLVMSATSGQAPLTVSATVTATDPESDTVSMTWHIPGVGSVPVTNFSGSATRSMTFSTPGEYVMYVAVNDNSSRYTGSGQNSPASQAGDGPRLVLRQVITVTSASATALPLDVDKSGKVDATDGVLILRRLNGGSTINTGIVLPSGQSNDTVVTTIDGLSGTLDVDKSGKTDATDGVLILRRLNGGSTINTGIVLPSGQNNDTVVATIDQLSAQ
ncbi:MAG: matrixin family metalloprotease [Magnetococcales bacterium]|nr:matrixin family metalloprotease [Magnetococcales bacterium]